MKLNATNLQRLSKTGRTKSSRRSIEHAKPRMSTAQRERVRKNAQKRKEKLLADKLVEIINPSLVKCRRCEGEIKLSEKSEYDNFHWINHRGRCFNPKRKNGAKKKGQPPPPPKKSSKRIGKIAVVPKAVCKRKGTSPRVSDTSSSPSSRLPQLTDSDGDAHSISSVPVSINPPSTRTEKPSINTLDFVPVIIACRELYHYIRVVHPDCAHQSPFIPIDISDEWSWSRLRSARFPSSAVRDNKDDEDVWSNGTDVDMDYSTGFSLRFAELVEPMPYFRRAY